MVYLKYQFATLQGEIGQHLFKQHPEAQHQNSVILQEGHHLEYHSTAIATLITSLTTFKWLGILLKLVPKPLRDCGYHLLRIIGIKCGKQNGIDQHLMKSRFS